MGTIRQVTSWAADAVKAFSAVMPTMPQSFGRERRLPLMRGESFGAHAVVAVGLSVIHAIRPLITANVLSAVTRTMPQSFGHERRLPLMRATLSGTRCKPNWGNFVARPWKFLYTVGKSLPPQRCHLRLRRTKGCTRPGTSWRVRFAQQRTLPGW